MGKRGKDNCFLLLLFPSFPLPLLPLLISSLIPFFTSLPRMLCRDARAPEHGVRRRERRHRRQGEQ